MLCRLVVHWWWMMVVELENRFCCWPWWTKVDLSVEIHGDWESQNHQWLCHLEYVGCLWVKWVDGSPSNYQSLLQNSWSFWFGNRHPIVICQRHFTGPSFVDMSWLPCAMADWCLGVPWGCHSVWMTGVPKCPQKDGFPCLIGKPWMNDKIYPLAIKHSNGKWAFPIGKWRVIQGFPVGRDHLFGRQVLGSSQFVNHQRFLSTIGHHWPSLSILINHH